MIRLLGHTLRLLLLLGLLGGGVWTLWPWLQAGWSTFDSRGISKEDPRLAEGVADVVRVYELEEQRWLEFPIITQGDRLRVITNAAVPPQPADRPAISWPYQVDYQLLDSAGQLVKAETYHQRTSVSWYKSPAGTPMTAGFYLNDESVPADSRIILINLRESPSATTLRLRLAGRGPGIGDVVARVYTQNYLLVAADAYVWPRLGRPLQEQLGQASVFGADLLTISEQINLTSQRWSPIAPAGALDHDYQTRKLYVVSNVETETPRLPILPAGIYVDRAMNGIMPIPVPGGMVDLELTDVAGLVENAGLGTGAPAPGQSPVTLVWYGPKPSQHAEYTLFASGAETRWAGRFDAGLLEIVAQRPLVARAYLRQEHQPPPAQTSRLPLFGQPMYQRLYQLAPGNTLDFIVAHAARQPTFWRVDAFLKTPAAAVPTTVQYEMLDDDGRVLRRGDLPVANVNSIYNSLVSNQTYFDRVSEPSSAFFVLPQTVSRVRLSSSNPLLIGAYTRPSDLPRTVRVPEDYAPGRPKEDRGQPFWFPVLPVGAADLLLAGFTSLMVVQDRPPQPDPEILAGRYDWQDYNPQGAWRGRYLLSPREPDMPLRAQARESVFQPLPVGTPVRLDLKGTPGRLTVAPTLLALRDRDTPCPVRVTMDGQEVYSDVLLARSDTVRLPPVAAGPHTLSLRTCQPPGRWLINAAGETPNSLVRRLAYRLDGKGEQFIYPKAAAGEQILTGVLRTTPDQKGRLRLRVTVETPPRALLGPALRLTPREWNYDILPDHDNLLPVLDTPTEAVGQGQRFFLPLGDDLPVGNYPIHMRLEGGTGYLSFYQVVPGEPAALELFTEGQPE